MKKKMSKIFLALIGITAFSVNAQADIVIYEGIGNAPGDLTNGSGDVENVLFNDDNRDEVAMTVDGFLNDSKLIVNFTGHEALETPSGGQARITAADYEEGGTFDYITFGFEDPTLGFDKVQFNIDASADGEVKLTFTDQDNNPWMGTFGLDASGQNFFTAVAINGQLINTVTISSEASIAALSDLAQVRMSPGTTPPTNGVVPEPATMVLLGAGMAGLGLVGSRKRKK